MLSRSMVKERQDINYISKINILFCGWLPGIWQTVLAKGLLSRQHIKDANSFVALEMVPF